MNKTFVLYVPGSSLSEFHLRSPWIELPMAFHHLGFNSLLICGKYNLKDNGNFQVTETFVRGRNFVKSVFEPFFAFKEIMIKKPDLVMISPFGSYLISIIPLLIITRTLFGNKKTRFWLKTDWNIDFTGMSRIVRLLTSVLFSISSHLFDFTTLETKCGVEQAKRQFFANSDKINRFPIGFPQDFMKINTYNNQRRKKVILCVARIARMKDQLTLIKAFDEALKTYGDWKLILAGPIDEADYMEELLIETNNFGTREQVTFTGFIDEEELLELYGTSSIFCLPSRYKENAGQVKYEAISAGLPVISTDVPCREENENMGILVFKAGDVQGLLKILLTLMEGDRIREQISKNAQSKLLSYTDNVKEFLKFYKL